MKKLLLLMLTLLPLIAIADDSGSCGENVTYTYVEATHTLTISGTGDMSSFSSDSMPWYSYSEDIQTVIILEGLSSIGEYAFYNCTSLSEINLPQSLTTLHKYAFCGCTALQTITIPTNIIVDKFRNPFYGCTGVKEVRWEASTFVNWFLTAEKLYLGKGVTTTSEWLGRLANCAALQTITVDSENPIFDSRNNCNAIIRTADNMLIAGCPKTVIPESVTAIGEYAFDGCTGLTEISIPALVGSIGSSAFRGCTGLQDVTSYIYVPKNTGAFDADTKANATLHVPFGTTAKYRATSGWDFTNMVEMDKSDDVITTITIAKNRTENVSDMLEYLRQFPDLQEVIVEKGNPKYSSNHGLLCTANGDSLLFIPPMTTQLSNKTLIIPKGVHVVPSKCFTSSEYQSIEFKDSVSSVYFPTTYGEVRFVNYLPPVIESHIPKTIYVPKGAGMGYYNKYRVMVIEDGQAVERVSSHNYLATNVYDVDDDGEMELVGFTNFYHWTNEGFASHIISTKLNNTVHSDSIYIYAPYTIPTSLDIERSTDGNHLLYIINDRINSNWVAKPGVSVYMPVKNDAAKKLTEGTLFADIDNDGLKDIVDGNNLETHVYTQQSDLTFMDNLLYLTADPEEIMEEKGNSSSPWGLNLRDDMFVFDDPKPFENLSRAVDVNNDGILDLIDTSAGGILLSYDDNKYFKRESKEIIYPYDIDNDGLVDFLIFDGETLYLQPNFATGKSEKTELYKNKKIEQVLFRDFDHDGDIDILCFFCTYNVQYDTYFVFLRNNGDGSFRKKEQNYPNTKYAIYNCRDYDADGCYELSVSKQESNQNSISLLLKVNSDFTLTEQESFILSTPTPEGNTYLYGLQLGDFNNDGLTEFYSNEGNYFGHIVTQTVHNTAPKKMSVPAVMLTPETNRLKISWLQGQDEETSACDLTYELRIGTQPGLGNILRAESLSDGRRQTTRDGNQGTMLQTLFNAAALKPGKYFIAVQAIDQGGLGGAFSDEFVYEHQLMAPKFYISASQITSADTLEVFLKSVLPDASYNWAVSEGEIVEQKANSAKLVFHKPGKKEVNLCMTIDGTTLRATPRNVYVDAVKPLNSDGINKKPFFDFNQDGWIEYYSSNNNRNCVIYKGDGKGGNEKLLLSTFADLNGTIGSVVDYNRDGYPDFLMTNCSKGDVFLNYGEQDYDFNYTTVGIVFPNYYKSWMAETLSTDLNNDGNIDSHYYDGYIYSSQDGKTYNYYGIDTESQYIGVGFYDVNRDGFPDIILISDRTFYYLPKDSTADLNYNEKRVLFQIPDSIGTNDMYYHIADFNNDGCLDLAFSSNKYVDYQHKTNQAFYIIKGKPNKGSDDIVVKIDGVNNNSVPTDIDNDGCLDFPYIGLDDKEMMLKMKPDFNYELVPKQFECNDIIPTSNNGYYTAFQTGIRNEAPQAPATVATKQTKDGLLITWSDAVDKETPYAQMRYNISVKRKGKTGDNSFVISPMNGLKDEAAIVPGYDYKSSTQMIVPSTVLTVGETYEIQVQSIDLWGAHSPMTAPVEFTMGAGGYIDVAEHAATGSQTTVKYQGTQAASYSLNPGEGGTIINNVGGGEFVVSWSTPGLKQLTLTAGAATVTSQVIVENPVDLHFSVPDNIYAGAPVAITLTYEMATTSLPIGMRVYYKKYLYRIFDYDEDCWKDVYRDINLDVDYAEGSTKAMVTFPSTGTYYIEAACSDPVHGGYYMQQVEVTQAMPEATISRVDWDGETGRYAVQWNTGQWPNDISRVVVLKESGSLNQFYAMDTVSVAQGFYIDPTSNPAVMAERYQLQFVADNGQVSQPCTPHRPMHIMLIDGGNSVNLLWDKYEGIDVDNYRVWRQSGDAEWELLAQMAGSQQSYTDLTLDPTVNNYYCVTFAPVSASRGRRAISNNGEVSSNVVSTASAIQAITAQSIAVQCYDEAALSETHQQLQLYAIVKPLSATVSQVEWSITEGQELAKVEANGRVSILPNATGGTATIQARTIDGSNLTATINIDVQSFAREGELLLKLSKGWNWVSVNCLGSNWSTSNFLSSFAISVERMQSQTQELVRDSKFGLVGTLSELSPTASYKLVMNQDVSKTWTHQPALPEDTPVSVANGWNWLGYIPTFTLPIADALADMLPQEGDRLLSQSAQAIFTEGQWLGDLTMMNPGEGYLLYSGKETVFTYPSVSPASSRTKSLSPLTPQPSSPWQYDIHQYPDNVAAICALADNIPFDGQMVVGAFCGDECRGLGTVLSWPNKAGDGMNNLIFLSIHGKLGQREQVSFRLWNANTTTEYAINDSIVLDEQCIGTPSKPLILHIGSATGITSANSEADSSEWYNLKGQRVNKPAGKGLFIHGTKKVVK